MSSGKEYRRCVEVNSGLMEGLDCPNTGVGIRANSSALACDEGLEMFSYSGPGRPSLCPPIRGSRLLGPYPWALASGVGVSTVVSGDWERCRACFLGCNSRGWGD